MTKELARRSAPGSDRSLDISTSYQSPERSDGTAVKTTVLEAVSAARGTGRDAVTRNQRSFWIDRLSSTFGSETSPRRMELITPSRSMRMCVGAPVTPYRSATGVEFGMMWYSKLVVSRNSRRSSSESGAKAMKTTSSSRYSSTKWLSLGISTRHGGQAINQTFRTTTLPLRWASYRLTPPRDWTSKPGAGSPIFAAAPPACRLSATTGGIAAPKSISAPISKRAPVRVEFKPSLAKPSIASIRSGTDRSLFLKHENELLFSPEFQFLALGGH